MFSFWHPIRSPVQPCLPNPYWRTSKSWVQVDVAINKQENKAKKEPLENWTGGMGTFHVIVKERRNLKLLLHCYLIPCYLLFHTNSALFFSYIFLLLSFPSKCFRSPSVLRFPVKKIFQNFPNYLDNKFFQILSSKPHLSIFWPMPHCRPLVYSS